MSSKTIIYAGDFKEIFKRCFESVKKCGWDVTSYDENEGIIFAETRGSFLSWGETVSIRVSKNEGKTTVKVMSEPFAQIIDWGKSDENIQKFYNWLEQS